MIASLSLLATTGPVAAARDRGGRAAKLTAVAALSRHWLLATYDKNLDSKALQASTYAFATPSNVNLPIVAVSQAASNQALISTGPQEAVTYTVKKPKTRRTIRFTGSLDAEPSLRSATASSSGQVLLTFSEPVGEGAGQASSYTITVPGTTTTLAVNSAAVLGDPTQVLLSTAAQDTSTYAVKVAGVKGVSGEYLDPTANSAQFTGSTAPIRAQLLSATPQGDTGLLLTFDSALDPGSATEPANYASTPNLFVSGAALSSDGKQVVLSTGVQYQVEYTVVANVVDAAGNPLNPLMSSASFTGTRAVSTDRPKVVSAASIDNKTVVVQFSKPMADSTPDTSHFVIVQTNVNPEVGTIPITGAAWAGTDRLSVRLTTLSQAEVTYQVTANGVTDLLGNPLADKTNVAGVVVDPTSFTFPGTPPTACPDEPTSEECQEERVNSDEDLLWDHEETRGWVVTIRLANGEISTREITSSPFSTDTDNDGLKDHEERALNIDPRDNDTDDDGITDYSEFNEYYSDPAAQDTDGDELYDGLEATFFFTSPIFDDTDGDQLKDGYEINVNRNAKVADLPQPVLKVGETRMGLDVRFIESNSESTRELDAKSVTATLVQSASQAFSSSESTTHEISTALGMTTGFRLGLEESGITAVVNYEANTQVTNTNSWTSEFTQSSSASTEQAHTDSLTAEKEAAKDSTVTREVRGADLQLAVTLESRSNVAFTAKNLQVAALIQDPDNPSRLTPIATLIPETGLDTSFNLGPLVPPKGPVIFTSTTVFPSLVDKLMNNPRGLVFRFANYDIVDEAGRNFAFTSQEVNDRTARIAIDYGGFDADGDGRGEETEILRVATGVIGRHAVDTNGDGAINGSDRKVVFDTAGKQVGLTLRDALLAAGLTHYDEAASPTSTLSAADRQSSYSTITTNGVEVVFRVRNRQVQPGSPKSWDIVGQTGIDRALSLDERILYPGTIVTLMFLEDVDRDGLPALIENVNSCKDSTRDSDGDGLDDRFEVLIGWKVQTSLGARDVRSRCSSADSDGDLRKDKDEAPAIITYDGAGQVVFNDGSSPRSVSDLRTTTGSAVVSSASANFSPRDVGVSISGTGIPANTKIFSVQSRSHVTMSADATATAPVAGVSAVIGTLYTEANAPRKDEASRWPRSVSDLATTSGSPVVTSATANFTAFDVGVVISGAGVPPNTAIASVQSTTQATMSANATATASGVAATLGSAVDNSLHDAVTDPLSKDTDLDGLSDDFEQIPYQNAFGLAKQKTSPEVADTDGDGLDDNVERKLGGNPRVDDSDNFTDSDRDGLTDAREVADENGDFLIDDTEKAGAGWDVVVTQMYRRLDSPSDPYSAIARIEDTAPATKRHLVDNGLSLQVGMIVDIKNEQSATAPLNTSVDAIENVGGGDAYVTFGTAFDGVVGLNVYRTVCKNGTCPAQHSTITRSVYSSRFDPDTDDDGLTDFEEWKLLTDPGNPDDKDADSDGDGARDGLDTDGDGLTDFDEVRGFKLQDGTTVKTKPTYVDTDNDRRSDGEEAGLAGGELIVRLPGGNVYQAFTSPTRADTDFDMLVDGDEQTYGIDPTLPNTDTDNRTDYSEILAGRRPDVPDMLVKMEFIRLFVEKDAEKDGDAGDFKFQFHVVKPDSTQQLVVHNERGTTGGAGPLPLSQLGLPWSKADGSCPDNNHEDRCFVTTPAGGTIIRVIDGQSLPFGLNGQGRTIDIGSVSTIDAVPESFGVRGWLEERDNTDHTKVSCRVEIFPDVFGNAQDGTGLVRGSQLRLGENSMAISRSITNCAEEPELKFTLVVSYTAQ